MLNTKPEAVRDNNLSLDAVKAFTTKAVKERASGVWKQLAKDSFLIRKDLKNHLLAALPDDELARLLPHLQTVSLKCGDNVYQSEDACEFLYFPETAVFSQLNVLEDGRTVETAMVGNEGVVGFASILSLHPKAAWTQTLISGDALRIDCRIFKREFARAGLLQSALFNYISSFISQITQRAVCNNHHRIEERLSCWLLMLTDRVGKNNLVLTHDRIAHLLGVHRPSVTCIAQDLRDKAIINYVRGRVIIRDRQNLENSACECYQAIKNFYRN